jgi:hypothetical protein
VGAERAEFEELQAIVQTLRNERPSVGDAVMDAVRWRHRAEKAEATIARIVQYLDIHGRGWDAVTTNGGDWAPDLRDVIAGRPHAWCGIPGCPRPDTTDSHTTEPT